MLLQLLETNMEYNSTFKTISIVIISIFCILSIITIIRMIYIKKNYINTVDAMINEIKYPKESDSDNGTWVNHVGSSNTSLTESSSGSITMIVEYMINGEKYLSSLLKGYTKYEVGDKVVIRYHKNDPEKIIRVGDKTEILLLLLFAAFIIGFGIVLFIF